VAICFCTVCDTYTLSYLPLFYNDLEERVGYLADVLLHPDAANDLLDAVEKDIQPQKRIDAKMK